MIVLFGGDLFTGNIMTHALGESYGLSLRCCSDPDLWHTGLYNRVVPLRSIIVNLLIVYIGNWAGTLFVAYFFGYLTHLFAHEQQVNFLNEVVQSKLEQAGKSCHQLMNEVVAHAGC
jgi:formate/nitrite transporter FocA (FNT family)